MWLPSCRARVALTVLQVMLWTGALRAQTATPRADTLVGEVTAADAAGRHLTLKADDGRIVSVEIKDGAALLRAKPGAKSLADATAVALESIAAGDRVIVRGQRPADGAGGFAARQVVVMVKDDIARKQEAERSDWRRRGVLGTVTAVDPASGEITLQVGRGAFARSLVIPTSGHTVAFRRYAPDSVKFSDARPSGLAEVKVGDELRALGERSADEKTFLAEQAVFGSFRLVSGSVTSIEPSRNEVTVRQEESGQKLTVTVGPDARLRRLPAELAARLSRRREGEGNPPPAAGARPEGGGEPPRWGRGPGGGGPEDLLDRMPAATFGELKVGDRVLVSSTRGGESTRLNAIAMVVGLEALAPASNAPRVVRGGAESGLPPELMDLGMSIP